ncbi:MAG: chitobiase/beta-hexosaminidase C-terminal domain-containing protein [Lachnospiraceae bacterium]|nr:chitobiase/beta-hexosaminidase C-terminal domain-containing protein [Lachnospiraceae bacterium]
MKKTVIVNIYNFIRNNFRENGEWVPDDFEAIRNQLILMKQYGFPGTYAIKHDALIDEKYRALLMDYLDENDEISVWWEVTEELCRRAGVRFRDSRMEEIFDDRVDSTYSLGYPPKDRKKLVDAYMADFYSVFGKYPETIGSWVIDNVTLGYAAEKYGVAAGCICRDQLGVDGFTLWGGYPNGIYFPCRKNIFIPAQTKENQLGVPVFRLLGPDPIYNFEADAREKLHGVYSLEPAWQPGRDPKFINWIFNCLTEEDSLGIGYAQVGQENGFLWPNIRPGFGMQLAHLEKLLQEGRIRIETMAQSARWFTKQYRLTPPMSYQASSDWNEQNGLSTQIYASCNYRVSLLGEQRRLRIRELFLFREDYKSRYLDSPMKGRASTFDALPVLFSQIWGGIEDRPFIRLLDENGAEPVGEMIYDSVDERTARARLMNGEETLAEFIMDPAGLTLHGQYQLCFDRLPVFAKQNDNEISMVHEGFAYSFLVARGNILKAGCDGVRIAAQDGCIRLVFGEDPGEEAHEITVPFPVMVPGKKRAVPLMAPEVCPEESVFPCGTCQHLTLTARDAGTIRYTLDGSEPNEDSEIYDSPIAISSDAVLKARLFSERGNSEVLTAVYHFSLKDMKLYSPTEFDWRPVFHGNGIEDLLQSLRGTTDYQDGRWRGTLQDVDVTAEFAAARAVESVSMGFLTHHRAGIVYPETVELYTGPDKDHLIWKQTVRLPEGPARREIDRTDVELFVGETVGALRVVARRYERMPQWCTYRGSTGVFTMADCLIVKPQKG